MTKLYKFRDFNKGSLELLINKQLWFASPATLNDPFEAESSYESVLEAVWAEYPFPQDQQDAYKRILDQQLEKTGICSFCKTKKNQLMWAHYADEHKGLCIGFNESKLLETNQYLYPIEVTYQADYPYQDIIDRFKYFQAIPGANNKDSIAGDIMYSVLGTKYTHWAYEKERRLLRHQFGAVDFLPSAVTDITFGLRMSERNIETVKRLLSTDEWNHVKFYKAVKSKKKYALEFKKI
ncbi:DUF2971 domain-containing protein [Vibrio harveyi]|uniref:DUF2971 domain-containing protein n=1 Tax=Vibrio harveyi TaxID=669 RepID=UPI0036F42B87